MGTLRVKLGQRIRFFRKAANLTQERLAQKVGIDFKYVADVEHGRKSVSLEVLQRLMEALDVEPSELFAFSLKDLRSSQARDDDLIGGLLKQYDPSSRQLVIQILKAIQRWRKATRDPD